MIDIQPSILPECDWCLTPVKEGEMVRFAYRLGPEDSHIDVSEIMEFTRPRFEVFINKPELILWALFCESCRSSP